MKEKLNFIYSNKKYLWMLGGGDMQLLTANIAKKNKYNLIVTDRNKKAACAKIADKFFDIDIIDYKKNYEIAKKFNFQICGIYTIASDCHLTVNRLAKSLGLHHTPLFVSQICKNKIKTRKFLKKFFIQPKSFLIKNYKEYKKRVSEINFDYVIKHLNLSGSKGFREFPKKFIINKNLFNKITTEMKNSDGILIEEKIKKSSEAIFSEMSAETIWQNGRIIYFNCVDRIFSRDLKNLNLSKNKFFSNVKEGYEIGHINPSTISKIKIKNIRKIMHKLGTNLGYKKFKACHVLKADIFFSDRGPIILEITPRLSGGYDSTGSSFIRGIRLSEAILKICQKQLFSKSDLSFFFKPNKKRVLVISKYLREKRIFYLDSAYTNLKKSIKVISNKIKMNQTIKNEQIKY
jgi:biotin carboxylase